MSKQSPSKVLLVCIYDTLVYEITNEIIYETFKEFGEVKKVLIFEKGEITKSFVEFYSKEQAINVKMNFDGKKLFGNICKIHIYFSSLKQVDLKNQFSKGKDFSNSSLSQTAKADSYEKSIESSNDSFNQKIKRYKSSNDQIQLNKAIERIRLQDQMHEKIKSDIIENILEDDTPTKVNNFVQPSFLNIQFEKNPLKNQFMPLYNDDKTNILTFNYESQITIKQVYNLFSNFGNIEKIIKKYIAFYIIFSNVEFAVIAKDYLNNTVLFGNVLRLRYCNLKEIVQKPRQYMQTIVFDPTYYRFNTKKSISINPPSNTLHISNMKKQTCSESKLFKLFSEVGKVDKVSILSQCKEKNMALVKMYSVEDGSNAIASLHNYDVLGRKIQISFTKSKI